MKKISISILSIVIALIVAFAACYFTIPNFNAWVKGKINSDDINNEQNDGNSSFTGGADIGEIVDNGVFLLSAVLPRSAFRANGVSELAETAYTFTAEVVPDYATDKTLDWFLSWQNSESKWASGFENLQTIPQHCVSSNIDLCLRDFGYRPRLSRRINPFKLGYANPFVQTHFNIPYECIFIDEAQKYLNSRLSMYYPEWQSRWYEQHGHNNIDIYLATQRPMLIDVNIRELVQFTEIVKCKLHYDRFGKVSGFEALLRYIENSGLFDKYMASGKTDKSCYTEEVYEDYFDVSACYDHQSCKPKFYDGHMDEDFDYSPAVPYGDSMDGYIKYLEEVDDELPQGFYRKGGSLC